MRRYRLNILQWEGKNKECMKIPTGDYSEIADLAKIVLKNIQNCARN